MVKNEGKVKLSLFNRIGIKNFKIEQFNFKKIYTSVEYSILQSVKKYQENLSDFELKDYNHIVEEKGRNTLECFDFNTLYETSILFRVFLELILKNSLSSTYMCDNNMEYTLKTRLNEMEKMSFYVIQSQNNSETTFYFKSFSLNSLFLRKNILIKVRDATRLEELDEKFLNLDTNFDFYFSLPNTVVKGLEDVTDHNPSVFIKNSRNFETILNFREVYDNHRDQVMDTLRQNNIVTNIGDFDQEFKLAKHRRKYIRISYDEQGITKPLESISKDIIDSLERQTNSLAVNKSNGEISFEIRTSEGVEVFLDLLGEHVLIAFDQSLQQVLSRSPIK